MSNNELSAKVREYMQLKAMAAEVAAEIEKVEDAIKAHMTEVGIQTVVTADAKVTWKESTRTTIDTKALKADFPDIYNEYGKVVSFRTFTVKVA